MISVYQLFLEENKKGIKDKIKKIVTKKPYLIPAAVAPLGIAAAAVTPKVVEKIDKMM